MYNEFQKMWDWDYIQQQQALQYHKNQVWQIADCTKKLKDFLESMDKVDPAYRQAAAKNCCAVLVEHMMKQQHQR